MIAQPLENFYLGTRCTAERIQINTKPMKKIILLTTCTVALAVNSFAEQGGSGHWVPGEFTDFSTTVPTAPGWVFGNFVLDYHDATASASKVLPLGGVLAAGATVNMTAEVPLLMYAYPVDFLGGTLASGVGIPYNWVTVKANGTLDRNGVPHNVTKEESTSGLGDIQLLPVMAGWTNGDFKYDFVMNVWAPTGDYDKDNLANPGLGYWTFTPMVGVSWLSSKIGTEATIFTGVDFNTKNQDADYQSGNIFHVDGTVAQHFPLFGGFAGAGASAFWVRQISNDSNNYGPILKNQLGGFMVNSYGIGPTVSYVHKVGKSDLVIDASWLPQTHVNNTVKGDFIWIKAMLVF
jgi:hypothetical protein